VRPHYEYAIQTLPEVEGSDVMPLLHFVVKDGVFSIDPDYIAPCLLLNSDQRFQDYIDIYTEGLSAITSHQNLVEGDGKRALLHYLFIMKGYDKKNSVRHFVMMLQEIAHAIDYYIISPNSGQAVSIPQPTQVDIHIWLDWFRTYLQGAVTVLDKVVLEDNAIDYEALLRQAKAELYDQLHEELIVKLLSEMKEELIGLVRTELENSLDMQKQALLDYINNDLKPELEASFQAELKQVAGKLKDDLSDELYERLYTILFEHLFNALFVPEAEDEGFIPLI